MPQDADVARPAGAAGPGSTPVPAAPRPGPPRPTAPRADDPALAPLEGLDELPVAEHVARFEAVHDALRARLESRPAVGGGA